MRRTGSYCTLALAAGIGLASVGPAEAGGPFRRRATALVPTVAVTEPGNANAPSPMLGTFYPTNYVIVGGDRPTGDGYSPLGMYGTNNMVQYGPFSIYRSTTAPVNVYSRGYDGQVYETRGHSFSTPFRPESSPVVYPQPNSYYFRPRGTSSPSQWTSGYGWVDQN